MPALLIILVIIALFLVIFAISTYNSLVGKRNKVANSWSQIDVQLKRRFDLIPNLLETVKGYAAHEKQTFEAVMQARTSYMSAGSHQDVMRANGELRIQQCGSDVPHQYFCQPVQFCGRALLYHR